jgi:hypothetical protein
MKHPALAACAALSLWSPVLMAQVAVALTPTRDNSLYQFDPGASNGAGTRLFCGNDLAATPKRALLAFDLAAVPPGSTILSARLELSIAITRAPDLPVTIHALTSDWGEGSSFASSGQGGGAPATPGDATWSHAFWPSVAWQNAGGDFVAAASATTICRSSGRFSWSSAQLAADVQAWLDGSAPNHGWIVLTQETGPQTARAFSSREEANAAARPALHLTFDPPSAAVRSLGSGCTGGGTLALSLQAQGLPTVPNPAFALGLSGGPNAGLRLVDYFGALLPSPLPLGQGCFLWGDLSVLLDGVAAGASTPLPVPNDPGLFGARLGVQAFSVDPASLSIAASNALELQLGR